MKLTTFRLEATIPSSIGTLLNDVTNIFVITKKALETAPEITVKYWIEESENETH